MLNSFPRFEHSAIALVFAVMAGEAFINDYAINRLSKAKIKKYINRSDVLMKWKYVPHSATGRYLSKDLLSEFKRCIDLRIKTSTLSQQKSQHRTRSFLSGAIRIRPDDPGSCESISCRRFVGSSQTPQSCASGNSGFENGG